MFQASLETSLLVSLLQVFLAVLNRSQDDAVVKQQIREYMTSLAQVERFSTVTLFMNKVEKELVQAIWKILGTETGGSMWGIS
jgi:hypothetical protein